MTNSGVLDQSNPSLLVMKRTVANIPADQRFAELSRQSDTVGTASISVAVDQPHARTDLRHDIEGSFRPVGGLDKSKLFDLKSSYHGVLGVFVRNLIVVLGLTGVLTATEASAGQPSKPAIRRVELISMNQATPARSPAALPDSDVMSSAEAAPLPSAFQVHDLSRRYVRYRMQQEFAQPESPLNAAIAGAPVGYGSGGVAPTSSIAVPDWLRRSIAITPVTFAPGCSPLTYRPSGILARTAEARRAAFYGMMSAVACEHGIPTGLFDAMIIRESGYNPLAISTANAFGLAQLMPGTAAGLGVNRFDPLQNMRGGARYLRQQLDRFGQVQLALAAYNAGPGRVRNGLVPRITETQNYVANIVGNWSRLAGAPAFQDTAAPHIVRPVRTVSYARF